MSVNIDTNAIPGYRLLRVLGRGGMATVYLAHQNSVDREVALKLMSKHLLTDPRFAERFLREARIAARLQHRHVVSIFDVGVHAEQPFIAMEHLSGGTIMPHEGEPLAPEHALKCVIEIALALDYAHGKGFIHRDVKPDNILLREDGSCVLSDFGIARTVDSATMMTKTGSVVGTPFYMSPEQLRGKEVDGRADLYSLGVVFYQLLSGKVPYTASDSLAIGIMHMTAPLPSLPRHLQHLQPMLDFMLAKEVGMRVQTGRELAELASGHLKKSEQNSVKTHPQPSIAGSVSTRSVPPVAEQNRAAAGVRARIEPQFAPQNSVNQNVNQPESRQRAGNDESRDQRAGNQQSRDQRAGNQESRDQRAGNQESGVAGNGLDRGDAKQAAGEVVAPKRMIDSHADGASHVSSVRVEPTIGASADRRNPPLSAANGKIEPSLGKPKAVLRAEPRLGQIDPAMDRAAWRSSAANTEKRSIKPWLWLGLGLALAGAAVWQKPRLEQVWRAQFAPANPEIAAAEQAERDSRFYDGSDSDALSRYARIVSQDDYNDAAKAGLQRAIGKTLAIAQNLAESDPQQASFIAEKVLSIQGDQPAALTLLAQLRSGNQTQPTTVADDPATGADSQFPARSPRDSQAVQARKLEERLELALNAERQNLWLGRSGALARYLSILQLAPDNRRAKAGLRTAETEAMKLLDSAIRGGDEAAIRRVQTEWELAQYNSEARAARLRKHFAQQTDVTEQKSQISQWLRDGQTAESAGQLTSPRGASAADRYLAVLALEPANAEAKAGLARVHGLLLEQAERALASEQYEMAQRLLLQAKAKGADAARVQRIQDRIVAVQDEIRSVETQIEPERIPAQLEKIASIESAIERGAIVSPPGDSALDLFQQASRLGPSAELEAVRVKVRNALQQSLGEGIAAGEFESAVNALSALRSLGPASDLRRLTEQLEESIVSDVRVKIESGSLDAAQSRIELLGRFSPKHPELEAIKLELLNAKTAQ